MKDHDEVIKDMDSFLFSRIVIDAENDQYLRSIIEQRFQAACDEYDKFKAAYDMYKDNPEKDVRILIERYQERRAELILWNMLRLNFGVMSEVVDQSKESRTTAKALISDKI